MKTAARLAASAQRLQCTSVMQKKTNTPKNKINLQRESLRRLQGVDLDQIVGGAVTGQGQFTCYQITGHC